MMKLVRWLEKKKEQFHLEREVRSFCGYLNRILFKERLILLKEQNGIYCRIYDCALYGHKDEKIRQLLKKSMNSAVLAVVVCASETGKDYYGFWLAGGSWHVFPGGKLLTKEKFFS